MKALEKARYLVGITIANFFLFSLFPSYLLQYEPYIPVLATILVVMSISYLLLSWAVKRITKKSRVTLSLAQRTDV